jgi:hypothetical protein
VEHFLHTQYKDNPDVKEDITAQIKNNPGYRETVVSLSFVQKQQRPWLLVEKNSSTTWRWRPRLSVSVGQIRLRLSMRLSAILPTP